MFFEKFRKKFKFSHHLGGLQLLPYYVMLYLVFFGHLQAALF